MLIKYLEIFFISCIAGWVFSIIGIPLPWTLGPLVTVIILENYFKREVFWQVRFRSIGMLFLGYVMGSPFNMETCIYILEHLEIILLMTFVTIIVSLLGGVIVNRFTGVSLATSLIGSIPGGLSQMAIVSEEIKESDPTAVILMQTVRVLTTVSVIPFLVLYGLSSSFESVARSVYPFVLNDIPQLGIFAVVIGLTSYLTQRFSIPGRYIVVPIIVTAILIICGVKAPPMPSVVTAVAQILVGIGMGKSINLFSLSNWKKIVGLNFLNVLVVIGILFSIDYFYTKLYNLDLITMFISTAPGGIAEMGLTAMMVHADLAMVISFQLFRMLFVLLVGIPILKWVLNRRTRIRELDMKN